jgi:hypothetical protein
MTLTPDEVLLLNPNTGTLPIFRSRTDADITLGIYRRHSVLVTADGNPWDLSFSQGLFNMASDADMFLDDDALESKGAHLDGWAWAEGDLRWLPLYEAKLLSHWDHRYATYAGATEAQLSKGTLPRMTDAEHDDPTVEPLARYWVAAEDVAKALIDPRDPLKRSRWNRGWFLGWRDITNASNERTFIPCVLPHAAIGHVLPLAFLHMPSHVPWLHACWSSLIFDFIVRQKLSGTHVTFTLLQQFACPKPAKFARPTPWLSGAETLAAWITPRVLELSYTSYRLEAYAVDLGDDGPPFRWDPARRELIRAELDGAMFHVYGLTRPEVEHVLDSFFVVRKYEERDHGEFRTKRLVLAAYDAMAAAARTGTPYQTSVDPAPGSGPRHRPAIEERSHG